MGILGEASSDPQGYLRRTPPWDAMARTSRRTLRRPTTATASFRGLERMKLVAPKPRTPESVTLETLGTKSGPRVNPVETSS